jgi:hypothetical protein
MPQTTPEQQRLAASAARKESEPKIESVKETPVPEPMAGSKTTLQPSTNLNDNKIVKTS